MPISHSGYGRSAPRDDRSYACKKSGKSATAISTAVVATATEAGQEQNPDQPFTAVIAAAAIVVAQQSAAVVVTAATAAEQQQDDPDAAVAEDTVTTVVIVAAGIIVAATVCSS